MSRPLKDMAAGLGGLLAIFLVAVLGYVAAGWPLLDAVYMVVITLFSVGYGEVRPIDSPELTIFTVTIIILGCSTVIYIMGAFVQLLTENQIQNAIGGKRMSKNIEQLSNHVIICGFGRVGQLIAAELEQVHVPFVVIDRDPDRLSDVESMHHRYVSGDATDESILLRATRNPLSRRRFAVMHGP
jgi:voltage-gated potassium channel